VGLIGAAELVADKATKRTFPAEKRVTAQLQARCAANGLILRALGDSMVFCPPLIITPAQIDELFTKFDKSLNETLDWV
jgi:4-aminobutyrate--pyruvate transaminase